MPRENTPSSKFQLRNSGELMHPGACMVCGSGTREEGYIDLGTYFDYEGQMYLCLYCIEEAAEVAGCLGIKESKFLQNQNEEMAVETISLKEQLTNANRRLRAYDDVIRGSFSDALHVSDASAEIADAEQAEFDFSDELIHGTTTAATNGESEPEEPTSGTGLTDSPRTERSDSLAVPGISL